ncbi:endonuclease domain-containing protein [Streptomyces sp. NPDC056257]|uniref:endonuclease domain-containing protein n=1 Tax=Streptomyces sp. NPDC056257 TaxID=3345765 RepID=UPI0035DEECB0
MLEGQGNCCAVCRSGFTEGDRPHIDHDHSCCPGKKPCGKCVRGLLCGRCNTGLGQFKDSMTFLRAAISYLESFR